MLIKIPPRKGEAIIMIDKTIDIIPATILNILDPLLLISYTMNNPRYTIKKQNICKEY
jgi:hypothetical protein